MVHTPEVLDAAENALDKLLCNCSESCGGPTGVRQASILDIANAIDAATRGEREACAKLVESHRLGQRNGAHHLFAELCELADEIRARGNA